MLGDHQPCIAFARQSRRGVKNHLNHGNATDSCRGIRRDEVKLKSGWQRRWIDDTYVREAIASGVVCGKLTSTLVDVRRPHHRRRFPRCESESDRTPAATEIQTRRVRRGGWKRLKQDRGSPVESARREYARQRRARHEPSTKVDLDVPLVTA